MSSGHIVSGEIADRQNTFDNPENVVPTISKLSADEWSKGEKVVRKHSWAFYIFEGEFEE